MTTSKNAHAPFPDVTGLRTSGPDFSRVGPQCKLLRVQESLQLESSYISEFFNNDLGLAVLSAWCVILFHYGSHEATNIEVLHTSQDGDETIVELDFAEHRELDHFAPSKLASLVAAAKQKQVPSQNLDHGYAAFYQPTSTDAPSSQFEQLQLASRPEISLALSYHLQSSSNLILEMKAAPAVHSEQSAKLQLRQIAALLQSYHSDHQQHALSVERFDWKLRASDNPDYKHLPDPDHLQGRPADRLETEFEYFADSTPDALALDFRFDLHDKKSAKWTYAEMNQRAEKVKQLLWSHGIGSASSDPESDHIVALYLEKSPETYLSFIGVLKAGAAWCPIDTDWPASRRQALLAKSNAKIVLTHDDKISKQLQEDLESEDVKSKGGMRAIRLDQLDTELQQIKTPPPAKGARSIEQLAYMIWTSGTTGLPKGVGIQHLAIIQAMRALRIYIPYGKDKIGTDQIRYLQYSAYNFDLSIMDCFYTWGLGGTICSCPRGVLLQDLVEVGNSLQPTHTLLTPAVMAMTERHRVPSLKVVISGGEKLSQVVADEWSKDCCLLNLYGPAEATLIAMNRRVPFGDRVKAPNIGVALPTVSCHALDKHDRIAIKGSVGELVLGGPQLARGYVGDPVKTADKFFPHPQLGRVYRTGDLVRQLDNQEFEYLGRIDDQVKINGIRIELLEINAAIKNSHERIKDSETMAFPKKDNESEQQIINFSALPGGESGDLLRTDPDAIAVARELQANAKDILPSYMVPNLFVILSHFPRTSSAKIDRVALKNVLATFDQLEWENTLANEGDEDDVDPATAEAEACLRKWLAQLCNVDASKIGRKTPFTSVGLDSIRAMMFSKRVSEEGYAVSVLDVARFSTLKSLSEHLQSSQSSSQERHGQAATFLSEFDTAFRPAVSSWLRQRNADASESQIQSILPCTPLQEGMLAESQRDKSSYRIQRQYQLPSDCNQERLARALIKTVDLFDSLRTSFADVGSLDMGVSERQWPFQPHFLQVVWKSFTPQIEQLDLDDNTDAEQAILDAANSKLDLDPFGSKPPVAFLFVKQASVQWLVVVAHHSTYDARSLGIFEDHVEAFYEGREAPASLQFSTALAQILPINQEEASRHSDVWNKALSGYPRGDSASFPVLSLTKPSKFEADQASLHQSRYVQASIDWAKIEAVCRELGVSARPLVQTAWALVLSPYIEARHLILGDSVSGRTLSAELDQVYGPVLSTVPVPFVLHSEQKLGDLIKEMDTFHTSIMEAQHTDLGAIRRMLQVQPREPLFHSVFVLEPAPAQLEDRNAKHFRLSKVADLGVATEHVLGVEVLPASDGSVKLGLSWQKSVISEDFGTLMLEQFDHSLSALCSSLDVNVGSFLCDSARADDQSPSLYSVTKTISPNKHAASAFVGVASSLSRQALSDDRLAVEIYQDLADAPSARKPTATISYAELERASNAVASLLASLPRNSVVGVCLERSLESYIAPLAILKAGHAYLPLDATLPLDRKQALIQDSGAALVIASSKDADFDSMAGVKRLDTDSTEFRDAIKSNESVGSVDARPDDVAFIIYTSGSTGKPKGCLLTQANLAAAIEGFHYSYEKEAPGSFESPARFLARSAEAFDVHLLEIFLSLRMGATIVTGPRAMVHDDIAKTMSTLEVTHACVVPSLFFSKGKRIEPSVVPSLRVLIIGGEALTQDLCQMWGSEGEERPVVLNAYGPSEATIGNSVARVTKRSRPSNIGAPFPGTQYMVLKEVDGQLVPTLRGEPGELCIAGEQVARGYLNRPDSLSFIEYQGKQIYRTGDMVRLHPSDEAEYLGRMDGSQVKVRGARLELGEVDAALSASLKEDLGVVGTAVTIHTDHPKMEGAARLVSFVSQDSARTKQDDIDSPTALLTQAPDAVKRATELRKCVRARLPQYMVPSLMLPLTYLPISPLSGKADRRLLKALYHSIDPSQLSSLSGSGESHQRELTSDEQTVSDLVRSSVRLASDIKLTHDLDLIMAGLDSLTVVTLASKLRKHGFDASVSSIMNDPTIEAIAHRPNGKLSCNGAGDAEWEQKVADLTEKVRSLPQDSQTSIESALPCVPIQIALVSQAVSDDRDTPRYITTITIDLSSTNFSAEQIRNAWIATLSRHEIYRTVFAEVDRTLVQVVLGADSLAENVTIISEPIPAADELAKYHAGTAKDIVANISSVPALRLALWRGGEHAAPALTLTCSHAIYDGDSIRMLLKEASDTLSERSQDVSALPFQAAARYIVGNAKEEQAKQFWSKTLSDFTPTSVPNLTGVRPEHNVSRNEELSVTSRLSFTQLEKAARTSKVTVQSILVAAFAHLLGLYAGESDVTLGLVLSGRSIPVDGVESIHGPCVTTVPLRLTDARSEASADLCKRAHQAVNALLPHQHVSLPQLMRWLDLSGAPFEALFSYLGQSDPSSPEQLFSERTTRMERDYPLALEVSIVGNAVNLHLAFDTQSLPLEQAKRMLSQYDRILASVTGAEQADSLVSEHLSILNKDCYVPTSPKETMVARFTEHVRESPDAPAIAFASTMQQPPQITSYAELDSLSTNIALHLVQKSGPFVGVHLNKEGSELYATILAIWKAGKAYLPLDPSLPAERLSYMIESVGDCPVVASQTTKDNLASFRCDVLNLEELIVPPSAREELPSPTLDAPCYLLFTSGSTGKPKAVQIDQRALAAALYSWERILPFTRQSRFLQLASIGFDVCLIEICMPLSLGFSIGTAPKQELLEDLTHSIKHLGVTIADLPAALAGTVHPEDVELEWLMSGGDVIDSRVVDEWNQAKRLLINAWGPTEATIGNTLGQVKTGATRNLIGSVYPSSSMFVLAENSTRILPSGAIGELVVGGPQLANCYYGREELTAEKFVFMEDGTRVYRTGDLGRFLADDTVECLGRIGSDRQVKVNGQRMELDEVSAVISAQSGVHDADVQYLKHPSMGSKQLVAFVAAADFPTKQAAMGVREDDKAIELCIRLEQEAAKRLAAYMVPTHWIVTRGGLPLTHNNKTDHKALAGFYERMDSSLLRSLGAKREGAISSQAWTESEEKLRKLVSHFCEVPQDQIARNTSFHRLGIDSISAIRLVKELRTAGFSFTVADVLSTPNIAALAGKQTKSSPDSAESEQQSDGLKQWVKQTASAADKEGWEWSTKDSIVSILPCTPLQSGMIAQSLASAGGLYFHHHAFELKGAVSKEQVAAAWQRLVQRLDILRTTFHPVDGAHPWAQAVHSEVQPRIVEHSGSFQSHALDAIDGQPSFEDEQAFRRTPYALHLWSRDGKSVVILSVHHALYDGSSLPQLLEDLESLISGDEASLPERLPFYRLVPSLLSQDEDVNYWLDTLHGFQPTPLAGSSTKRSGTAVLLEKRLALTSQDLESRCRAIGVSPQVLCNLAFGKLLAIESQTRDVCFGQLFGLLDLMPEADTAVGPAFNTVATRIRFEELDEPANKVAAALQVANDAGRTHRRAALRDVQARLGRGQLFDALFDYQRAYEQEESKLCPIELNDEGAEQAQYTLNIALVQGPTHMSIVAKADRQRYDQKALSDLVDRLELLLQHLSSQIEAPISALPEASGQTAFPQHLPQASAANGATEANGVAKKRADQLLNEDGRKLAGIISKVAGVHENELHGDTRLTQLGLDSISAIRIASQARKAGLNLRMGEIVAGETINGILSGRSQAHNAKANGHANGNGHVNGVTKASSTLVKQVAAGLDVDADRIERVLPILAGQKLWLATWARSKTGRGDGGFSFAYRLPGASSDKAKAAWHKLRQLQPILRTAFLLGEDASAAQVVLKAESISSGSGFAEAQIEHRDAEQVAKEVVGHRAAEGWPDLTKPPVQLTLIGDILVFSLHHALYDAFSIDLLVRDFASLYGSGGLVSSNQWPEAVEYVAEDQQRSRSDAEQHWSRALSPSSSGMLSKSNADSDAEAFHASRNALPIASKVDVKLRRAGLTLPALVVAAWSTLLSERLAGSSPVFGLYQLGRSTSFDSIEKVQGPLLNCLPLQIAGDSMVEKARAAVAELKTRGKFEQTDLVDAHRWAGLSENKPSYNTFVNILIGAQPDGDAVEQDKSLEPVDLGHPLDYAKTHKAAELGPKKATAVTKHAAIWQPDVNLDVVLKDGSVDMAIKAKTAVITEAELPRAVARLVELIETTIDQL